MKVFGVRVDNVSSEEVDRAIDRFLGVSSEATQATPPETAQIVTLNGEILLHARRDPQYRALLEQADLTTIDGTGVRVALWRRGTRLKHRRTGADLLPLILTRASASGLHVHFALADDGLVTWEGLRVVLAERYPHLICSGALYERDSVSYGVIQEVQPQILICNFGAPAQDVFLSRVKNARIETLRLCIGVGGACDFLAGTLMRAPHWMRRVGLEWLYRLWQQPWRWRRIIRAVIVFPFFALISKE